MTDYDKLKTLAEKATPGPWGVIDPDVSVLVIAPDLEYGAISICTIATNTRHDEGRYNRDFIAAANPATILALLAENYRLKAKATDGH